MTLHRSAIYVIPPDRALDLFAGRIRIANLPREASFVAWHSPPTARELGVRVSSPHLPVVLHGDLIPRRVPVFERVEGGG